jgi:GNAT superfamily N-acetyltransferase
VSGLPADLRLRDLTPDDSAAAARLVNRCDSTYAEWTGPEWRLDTVENELGRWERAFGRPGNRAAGAFNQTGGLVASIGWRDAADESLGVIPGVAHVYALFTDPARWRQGIAAGLLDWGESEMASADYEWARLWTPRDAPARAFYEARGWTEDGRARWEEELRLDLVGYEKKLSRLP